MKLNTNSNLYTFIYSAVMVIIVAVLLAVVSQALAPKQQANILLDKQKQILGALKVDYSAGNPAEIYMVLVNDTLTYGGASEHSEPIEVYVANLNGETKYILPLSGKGLWGGIGGYLALDADKNTIYGVNFNHESETPGLGAKIVELPFREQFEGKHIRNAAGEVVSVAVLKSGKHADGQEQVDAISGATITSSGVSTMLEVNKTKDTLLGPLNANNPVVVQILGICSALAVTVQLKPALVMGIAVTIIVAMSNVIVSLLRNTIPMRVRIIVQLVVVAALVTLVSEVLKAFAYDVAMQLSVYLGLIITNCILMGRLEAFAMTNNAWDSLLDGLGNGLGYAIILVIVAFVRELFGSGQLLGFQVIPQWCYDHGYENCGMMLMPAMALILVGCVIWAHRSLNEK